jgi:hypothetical protein
MKVERVACGLHALPSYIPKNHEPRRRRGESGQKPDEAQTNKEGLISS